MPPQIQHLLSGTLPAFASALYESMRDWQALIACLLVIAAVHSYHRVMVRIVKRKTETIIQTTQLALQASNAALQKELADLRTQLVSQEAPQSEPPFKAPDLASHSTARMRLDTLRRSLRRVLAELSVSDGVAKGRLQELQASVATFEFGALNSENFTKNGRGVLARLQSELTQLQTQAIDEKDGKRIWDSLVHINRLAKQLDSEIETRSTALAASAAIAMAKAE